jgi:hypothetical protein
MAITLITDPSYEIQVSPAIKSRWLATESPNNFRLLRRDWIVSAIAAAGSPTVSLLTVTTDYTGTVGSVIALYSAHNGAMYTGEVLVIDAALREITTSIDFVTGMTTGYLQDNTLHAGYYFEGRLTINNVLHPLTIYATPDTYGYADLDVSGILRIMTSLGKTGDYSETVMKEPTKSGRFTLEYRECWYGSDEAWTEEENIWYYGEVVQSEEQGSNLHEYVAEVTGAPFLNLFERPVYFHGLPFDLSFIIPDTTASPEVDLTITIKNYNSANTPGTTHVYTIPSTDLAGFINSLTIDASIIDTGAAYFTIEIT